MSSLPTPTEAGPKIEGATDFAGTGTTAIWLLVAGSLAPPALVATTWHVIVKPISPETVVYESVVWLGDIGVGCLVPVALNHWYV